MPNDPRLKFKKKVYDTSRNLLYEERTGGGGGTFPSGGGGGPPAPDPKRKPTDTIFTPTKKPVNPVNPFDPFSPFNPAIVPFDPYQRKQKSRLEDFMKRDAQDYYNRSQIRPKIATPKFDNDVAPSALPNVDILVDAPPAPAPSTLPNPNSRLLFGAKATAISGITGKLPPRIDIKPVDLINPPPPAKITRKLIGPDEINDDLQGTTREQIDALEAKRLREEGKTTIDATTPLEQDIAARMHEMRYAGATDAEMVKEANNMRKIDAARRANKPIDFVDSKGKSLADSPDTPERYNIEQEIAEGREALKDPLLSKEEAEGYKEIIADLEDQLKTLEKQKATKTLKETAQKLKLGEKPSLRKRLFDMFKGKPKPQGIADLKKELRSAVADAPLEEQLKLHEREAINPSNTPEQIEAVKQNIADIKKEIISEQMAKVDSSAKAASSKVTIGKGLEAQKIELTTKTRPEYNKRTPFKEKAPPMSTDAERLKLAKKALQNINEDIKNKGGFKDMFGNDVVRTPQEIENLKKTKANIEKTITDLETKVGTTSGASSNRQALQSAKQSFTKQDLQTSLIDRIEALEKQLLRTDITEEQRAQLNEAIDIYTDTLADTPDPANIMERAVSDKVIDKIEALDNKVARAFEKAPAPAPARPVAPEPDIEIGSLDARNHITRFNEYYEGIVSDNLYEHGFETPNIPESIRAQGELAIKKYIAKKAIEFMNEPGKPGLRKMEVVRGERTPTEIMITQERAQRKLDTLYNKAEAQQASSSRPAPRPPAESPGPSPTPSPPERSIEMQSSSQRRGLMDTLTDRLSGSRAYQPMDTDILDTIDEMQGNVERGGRVETSDIDLQDLGGNVERGGRLPTADNSPASSGTTTPAEVEAQTPVDTAPPRPVDTPPTRPATDRVTRSQTRGLEPMELETVPLGGSARPSARGRGRAKIEPIRPVAPKPTLKFGRGTDVNIQGGRNNLVASEFMNTTAGRASSSLRALGSRVPTLKAPSAATLKTIGIEGGKTIAGLVIGIGVSYLMAKYFKEHPATDKYSQIGQEFAVSFSGAAAGNLVIRALGIAGRLGMKTFTKAGAQLAAKEALYATGEAAAFVAVQMAVEMSVEAIMDNYKFSHAASKTTAAFTGGVLGAGIGFKQGGYAGLALMTAFSAYSTTQAYFEGKEMDEAEAAGRKTSAEVTVSVNNARRQLVKNMAQTNNNYDAAYALLSIKQRRDLSVVGDDAQELFKNSLLREFDPLSKERYGNPFVPPEVEPEHDKVKEGLMMSMENNLLSLGLNYLTSIDPAGGGALAGYEMYQNDVVHKENEIKDKYYQEYIEWYMHKMSTPFYNVPQPSGPGLELLERDTGGSWRSSAEFSAELVYQQNLHYTAVVNKAREQVLDEWHSNMVTMGEMTNRDIVDTANLGGNFADQYDKYIVTNATAQLAAQFNENGVNYRDADQRLVAIASRDPTVLPALDHYYEVMIQLSKDTELPIAELARLNALPEVEQGRELGKINLLRERVIRQGLESDKAAVDEFNAGLIRDMQSYGDNFEAIMTNINQQQMLMGYSYLYGTNRTDFYRQLHLEAPVVVIPPNPYASSTEFDYNKNRTPNDTLIYGYRYNLTDEQNQELEDKLYTLNREKYQNTGKQLTQDEVLAQAGLIYDRDAPLYRKSDEEVAKDNNMTLEEYYAEYGYNMGKIEPPEPIEWLDITERDPPPLASSNYNIESDDRAGERQANAAMQQARIEGGDIAELYDPMATGAYAASQRALVDAQGGNNLAGDQPQPRTNENGEVLRQENDPNGP
jgi:hypothetical protein